MFKHATVHTTTIPFLSYTRDRMPYRCDYLQKELKHYTLFECHLQQSQAMENKPNLPKPPATEGLLIELPLRRSNALHFHAATSATAAPQAATVSPKSPSSEGPREPHV